LSPRSLHDALPISRLREFHTPVADIASTKWINAGGSPLLGSPTVLIAKATEWIRAEVIACETSDRRELPSQISRYPKLSRSPSGHTNFSRLHRRASKSTAFAAQPSTIPRR